ncbi:MAG: hypothetical protein ACLUHE_12805 [Christensenellales bacterium]
MESNINFRDPSEAIEAGFIYMTEDRKHDGLALGLDVEANITLGSLKKFSRNGVMKDKAASQNASDFCQKLHIRTPSTQQKARYLSGRKPAKSDPSSLGLPVRQRYWCWMNLHEALMWERNMKSIL